MPAGAVVSSRRRQPAGGVGAALAGGLGGCVGVGPRVGTGACVGVGPGAGDGACVGVDVGQGNGDGEEPVFEAGLGSGAGVARLAVAPDGGSTHSCHGCRLAAG
jgi:hypothetical protein